MLQKAMKNSDKTYKFCEKAQKALQLLNAPYGNIFLTGRAGTGKSTLIQQWASQDQIKPVFLAPTGIAALNIQGETIHRFFGFGINTTIPQIRSGKVRPYDSSKFEQLKVLIIDEISMVRADMLDMIDEFLRIWGPDQNKPFGGVKMVFVGDLFQLPPILKDEDATNFLRYYKSPYFYDAHVFKQLNFTTITLNKVYRQEDPDFLEILNSIREGTHSPTNLNHLNKRYVGYNYTKNIVVLTAFRDTAKHLNKQNLDELKTKEHNIEPEVTGHFPESMYPNPKLTLKVGARVLMNCNDEYDEFVNGDQGTVHKINLEEGHIVVHLDRNEPDHLTTIYRRDWKNMGYDSDHNLEVKGTYSHFPMELGWAITIHKSQGKTFDRVVLDMGKGCFSSGQLYVALSRCRSLSGLELIKRVANSDVQVDSRVKKFMEGSL